MGQGQLLYDSDEDNDPGDLKPLGCMKETLQTATVHKQLLERQLKDMEMIVKAMCTNNHVLDENGMIKMALTVSFFCFCLRIQWNLKREQLLMLPMSPRMSHCRTD